MAMGLLKRALHLISIVAVFPLAAIYKLTGSRGLFAGQGQLLSLLPGKAGSYLRVAYYSMTLEECNSNGYIGFGSFFAHPDAKMGEGVYIGAYCIIGKALLGDHTTIGSGVHILSGKRQHGFSEIGKPIQEQKGVFERISIGENCWIGDLSVVMASLGRQNVVGAGSVVTKHFGDFEVLAGNPARVIKNLLIENEATGNR